MNIIIIVTHKHDCWKQKKKNLNFHTLITNISQYLPATSCLLTILSAIDRDFKSTCVSMLGALKRILERYKNTAFHVVYGRVKYEILFSIFL